MPPKEIQKFLQTQFPDSRIEYAGEGWTSTAFFVGDKIVRIPKTGAQKYKKEAKVLKFLHGKLTVPIPLPQVVEGDLTYAIHTKIEGNSWNIQTFNALDEQSQNNFCKDIATFFYELHKIPTVDVISTIPAEELKMHTLEERTNIRSYLKEEFSTKQIDALYDFTRDSYTPQTDLVLLHKDFWEANSLVDKQHRLTGVFDFANAGFGERADDFRTLYHPNYFPLLKKVLIFYNNMTGIQINLKRIADLEKADCLFCIQHLGKNAHLKQSMPQEWEKQISRAKSILNDISSPHRTMNISQTNFHTQER